MTDDFLIDLWFISLAVRQWLWQSGLDFEMCEWCKAEKKLKDKKQTWFHSSLFWYVSFDPVFVQYIRALTLCWCLSTAHTTSVANGQCVLRLILCTLQASALHGKQTICFSKSQPFDIHSLVLFLTWTREHDWGRCDTGSLHLLSRSVTGKILIGQPYRF